MDTMIKKLMISLLFFCPLVLNSAHAINIRTTYAANWGYASDAQPEATYGDFMLAGGLRQTAVHGTWYDEWGAVGMIASKIVEHGAYFCPYQLQCANKRGRRASWTMYYRPDGFSVNKCVWLCESGYSGADCMPSGDSPSYCDKTPYTTSGNGKFSKLAMKTWGKNGGQVEAEVMGFAQWGSDPECDVVLGIVKFMEHGVIAAPIQACCGRNGWRGNNSFISSMGIVGNQKVLCAAGYKPNSSNSDCEPIDAFFCDNPNIEFCTNFSREGYDSSIHTIKRDGGCAKYFCSEAGKAFPAVGQATCEECATGVKGGSNPKNGVCVKCETGQYFDSDTGECESADAYTTIELQYGKGQTKNTNREVNNQCWTVITPADYAKCVANGGVAAATPTIRSAVQPVSRVTPVNTNITAIN